MEDKNLFKFNDTIASIATVPGMASVGIIKISGPKSLSLVSRIFLPRRRKDLKKEKTYTLHYGWIIEKSKVKRHTPQDAGSALDNGVVDEVLISVMKAPFSYTREDVVEVYSHSGQVVLNKILDLVLEKGARLAQPGEFTRRAFLSGRIDLTQAEAVLDIVQARSEQSLKIGLSQLKGKLSDRIKNIERLLKNICVELEADLSFPEDIKINKRFISRGIKQVKSGIEKLLENSREGRFLREGVSCVICGRANVGKSSLLNMLLKEERVIVTPLAGTTRDVVEDNINIRGMPLKIYDTAGILEPKDLIAKKAMEKSYAKIEEADLVLLVFDASQRLCRDDFFLIDKVKEKQTVFVINKDDLPSKIDTARLAKYKNRMVRISALKNRGLENLEKAILKVIFNKGLHKDGEVFVSNARHISLFKETLKSVDEAEAYFNKGHSLDFVFFSLKDALTKLSQITGKDISDDILDSIFSNFCIGK
ncbi:MAG: tRNA uridine-5-carboxymethylaminomethyl(34) synthesis GTPase MnmE [Candidatus Omnitrophica bacterium]|nr:tRNA uridine-5-carboxymethylaminomethyl(34) synthesis GTPase MnmE [Candidatus Omnitrophota bacterium]